MLHLSGMVESVLGFSYNEVGFLTAKKFTHDVPENIPQTGAHNPARYIGGIREFRCGPVPSRPAAGGEFRCARDLISRDAGARRCPRFTR